MLDVLDYGRCYATWTRRIHQRSCRDDCHATARGARVWTYQLAVLIGTCITSLLVGVMTSLLVRAVLPWDFSFWSFLLPAFAVFGVLATPRGAALWHEAERRDEVASLARRLVATGGTADFERLTAPSSLRT